MLLLFFLRAFYKSLYEIIERRKDMDELKLNLNSKFMNGIVTRLLGMVIRKKLGYNVDIQLNSVNVIAKDGKVHIHVDVDAETTNDEFMKIVKSIE